MSDAEQIARIKLQITQQITQCEHDIATRTAENQPIAPDNAIGRLSRMDALTRSEVLQSSIERAQTKLRALHKAMQKIKSDDYGYCERCDEMISWQRLQFMPESQFCIYCADTQAQ